MKESNKKDKKSKKKPKESQETREDIIEKYKKIRDNLSKVRRS